MVGPGVRAGPGGARVTATVLFAAPALVVARNAYEHPRIHHVTVPGLLFAAGLLAGLAAVVLLWHRSSGLCFRADVPSSRPATLSPCARQPP